MVTQHLGIWERNQKGIIQIIFTEFALARKKEFIELFVNLINMCLWGSEFSLSLFFSLSVLKIELRASHLLGKRSAT
jgi:hypothetical protein